MSVVRVSGGSLVLSVTLSSVCTHAYANCCPRCAGPAPAPGGTLQPLQQWAPFQLIGCASFLFFNSPPPSLNKVYAGTKGWKKMNVFPQDLDFCFT
jgi:hypothetical protein